MNPGALNFRPNNKQNHQYGNLSFRPGKSSDSPSTLNDSRSQVECRFFQRGAFRYGEACLYLHTSNTAPETSTQKTPDFNADTVKENARRTIGGSLIHFEAGATIKKVSLASDFSAIQISPLPHDSGQDTILALLHSHGLNPPIETEIRITRQLNLCSALVKVEDPEFANLASRKLGPQIAPRLTQGTLPVATPVESPISSDSNTLRVDCRKVHISWHKAYKTVWLNFGNSEIAERACKKFRDGTYRILNQSVQCGNPTRGGGRRNPLAWTVCLTEVPASATESDISRSIRQQGDKPRNIELGNPTYKGDSEICAAQIKSLFTSIGSLEWWEFTPDTTGKRMKASARFFNEDDAMKAAQTLNQSALPFNPNAKLTVQLVHTVKFKVSETIYEAIQSQIKAHLRDWKASHLHFTAYENTNPPKWYRVLKVEGEGAKEVVEAKNTIMNILSGVVAMDGSSVLWHPALRGNGLLSGRVKQLERELGVVIIRNKTKSQLRLYGPRKRCEEAQTAIVRLLENEKSEHFYIDLNAQELSWILRGGLKMIQDGVGPEKVNFNITSTPKRIIIVGTIGDHEVVTSIMNKKEPTQKTTNILNNEDCSVCWNEAENPVKTGCHHVYCLDCFENLCMSATTQSTASKISCVGESGTCSKALSLPELQEHLSSTAFEELLEQSFASYIRLNPQSLKYCPSVDCGYVYRISDAPKMRTCPNCLVAVCTACQAQHGSMTCADYKDLSTGGLEAFERLKKERGIKDCPKCKTPLEKIDGCDHMTCRCGAHICWVCLRVFESSKPCYEHMNQEHNGIGLNHLQRIID
ncbi:hypothetical protein F4776DRAFT_638520 [Hypoxylon sp. NC0597]|nr:hypothetical protein F4776DRAFT_638520 [Hypoxylon sp. NC0597]